MVSNGASMSSSTSWFKIPHNIKVFHGLFDPLTLTLSRGEREQDVAHSAFLESTVSGLVLVYALVSGCHQPGELPPLR